MSTENITESVEQNEHVETEGTPEALGDAGKKAIQAEREARKAAEQARRDIETRLAEATSKLQEHEDADRSVAERLEVAASRATELANVEKSRADVAEAKLLRLEVAQEKGISGDALALLSGGTREELETKADSILALINASISDVSAPVVYQEGRSPSGVTSPESDFAAAMRSIL